MSNVITFEMHADDRARLDRLSDLLGKLIALDAPRHRSTKTPEEQDDLHRRLKETLDRVSETTTAQEAQNTPQEAPKKVARPEDTVPWAEKTAPKAEPTTTAPAPDVELSDIQGLVIKLATAGKKAEARDIVKEYAERVIAIPPAKYGEVFARLKALEG